MAFVVPGVCRFTINQTYGGRNVANVIDMDIDSESPSTREECIEDQADVLWNQWCDDILPNMTDGIGIASVTWVDLDTSSGSVGEVTTTGSNPAPQTGGATGTGWGPAMAVLVRKVITQGRGRKNGRMYLTGYNESLTQDGDPGALEASSVPILQGDVDAFKGNIEQDTGVDPPFYSSHWVVTHVLTRDEDEHPLTGDSRQISNLIVEQTLATQRRRQRR
jgi:hypothetical protein